MSGDRSGRRRAPRDPEPQYLDHVPVLRTSKLLQGFGLCGDWLLKNYCGFALVRGTLKMRRRLLLLLMLVLRRWLQLWRRLRLLLLSQRMWLATLGIHLLRRNVSYDGSHLGYDCSGARFGGASSLHGLPALGVLFTFEGNTRCCVTTGKGGLWVVDARSLLPSLSTGAASGWLDLATEWLHLTLSAQLGPVWVSRPAVIAGGGPLKEIRSLFFLHFYNLCKSKKFQPSEDSAYLTLQHSQISRDRIGQQALHHDQYPFPAASDYRAVHILSGCFSSL